MGGRCLGAPGVKAQATLYRYPEAARMDIDARLPEFAAAGAREHAVAPYVLVAGISAITFFGVLAFGATEQWAVVSIEMGCAFLLLYWMWSATASRDLELQWNAVYVPVALFGLIVAVQIVAGRSAYVHATRVELWKYAAYGSLLLVANQFGRNATEKLLKILTAFGTLVAIFALAQYLTYNGSIYWTWPALPTSFGPYVDHSHYAGLMELLTPIAFALVFSRKMKRYEQVTWMMGGMLMAATIFLSGSRGGMTAFTVQMLFFAGLLVFRTSRRMLLPVAATIAAIAAFVLWVDDGRVLTQVAGFREPLSNVALISRYDIAKDLPRMWRDRPLLGWGLGTFPIVYPQYKSYPTDLVVNQAHNDYLQALVETGIAGFACVAWFIGILYRSAVKNLRAGFEATTNRVLGPVVGCTGILVHSLFDFNLHIPANAAMFFVLCGIATQRAISEY